ncbi:E-selectin-like [Lineus longissimus]|uniref:E-selectin-like n=1 Tax=Lineus longissimus TaxID=88925 RepID=UPI002B4C2A34
MSWDISEWLNSFRLFWSVFLFFWALGISVIVLTVVIMKWILVVVAVLVVVVITESKYFTAPFKRTELICDDDQAKNAEWAYSNRSGNCYRLFHEEKNFEDAKAACKTIMGSLAEIKHEEEQLFLDVVLKNDWVDHWVYGTRVVGQNYTWGETKDTVTYYNFLGNKQPDERPKETCLVMTKNYVPANNIAYAIFAKWNSADCNAKNYYICQKTAKRCPDLPKAEHTVPKPPFPYIELTVKYSCAPGYELPDYAARYRDWQAKIAASPNDSSLVEPTIKTNPTMEYLCEFPGKWATGGSIAPCEPISCVEPPKRPHTTLNSTNRVYPSYIGYKCDNGYFYEEYNTTVMTAWCGPDKQWIDVPKECDTVECGEFPIVFNASANAKLNHFKDTVVWQCNQGFMFPDGSVRQWVGCRENYVNNLIGRWNVSKLDDCERLSCPPLSSPAFTKRDSNDTAYATIVTYSCVSKDYEFPDGEPIQLIKCSEEAQWKPKVPVCTKKPSKLETKGKKYVPEPKEATAAESIGYSALIFVIIFLILIFLLDLTTIWKDIRMLKYNCRHFMKRVNSNKTSKRADLQPIPKDLKDQ